MPFELPEQSIWPGVVVVSALVGVPLCAIALGVWLGRGGGRMRWTGLFGACWLIFAPLFLGLLLSAIWLKERDDERWRHALFGIGEVVRSETLPDGSQEIETADGRLVYLAPAPDHRDIPHEHLIRVSAAMGIVAGGLTVMARGVLLRRRRKREEGTGGSALERASWRRAVPARRDERGPGDGAYGQVDRCGDADRRAPLATCSPVLRMFEYDGWCLIGFGLSIPCEGMRLPVRPGAGLQHAQRPHADALASELPVPPTA